VFFLFHSKAIIDFDAFFVIFVRRRWFPSNIFCGSV